MCTVRENAGFTKEKFDIRWVSTGIRVSVNCAPPDRLPASTQIAPITFGTNCVLNRDRLNNFVPGIGVDLQQTLFGRRVTQEDARPSHETVWTVALVHDKVIGAVSGWTICDTNTTFSST